MHGNRVYGWQKRGIYKEDFTMGNETEKAVERIFDSASFQLKIIKDYTNIRVKVAGLPS